MLRYSDIPDRVRLGAGEAVSLALGAATAADALRDGRATPVPEAAAITLDADGRVRFETEVGAADEVACVPALSRLITQLLALDASTDAAERPKVPGGLMVLLARASGSIDLPPPTYAAMKRALLQFAPSDPGACLREIYARCTPVRIDLDRETVAAAPRDRRQTGVSASDLRRDLREADRELFVMAARGRRHQRRLAVAAAALLAIAGTGAGLLLGTGDVWQPSEPAASLNESETTRDAPATAFIPERPAPIGATSDIPADLFSPSFARDSSELLFHRGRSRSALLRASFGNDGSATVTTILDDGAANYHAVPSPDGRWIAYDSDRDGTRGVFVARRDGTHPRKVSGTGYASVPRWSPDGRALAFSRAEPQRPRVWNVWTVNLATGALSRVSDHRVGQAWSASWFSDGDRLAWTVEDRLVIKNLRTGESRVFHMPESVALLRTPAVAPNGQTVAIQVYRDGMWLLDVATGNMRRVLEDPLAEEFAWSPDGREIAYHTRVNGHWGLWRLRVRS